MSIAMIQVLLNRERSGIFGITILCPLLAWVGYYLQRRKFQGEQRLAPSPSLIDIIIPGS